MHDIMMYFFCSIYKTVCRSGEYNFVCYGHRKQIHQSILSTFPMIKIERHTDLICLYDEIIQMKSTKIKLMGFALFQFTSKYKVDNKGEPKQKIGN